MGDTIKKLVRRDEWRAYMETGDPPKYELIGEGFTSFSESKNPQEYSRRYISEKSERTDVVGYSPSIAYSVDVYSGDPVIREIVTITDGEMLGSDTHRNIVSVNMWENGSVAGSYKAYMRPFAIIPDTKGDGTDALIYTGTIRAVGDAIEGMFDVSAKTFTPAAAPEPPTA